MVKKEKGKNKKGIIILTIHCIHVNELEERLCSINCLGLYHLFNARFILSKQLSKVPGELTFTSPFPQGPRASGIVPLPWATGLYGKGLGI